MRLAIVITPTRHRRLAGVFRWHRGWLQARRRISARDSAGTSPDSAIASSNPSHIRDQHVDRTGQTIQGKTIAMLKFMGPALILPLSDPLMSLIDAISLGRVCNSSTTAFPL
jgi:hypothetical protein